MEKEYTSIKVGIGTWAAGRMICNKDTESLNLLKGLNTKEIGNRAINKARGAIGSRMGMCMKESGMKM